MMKNLLAIFILFAGLAAVQAAPRPNVLFIAVDDWNDWVGCLGHAQAKTPNVDRLAKRGLLFTNAHCVSPVCNPSRVALMTGLRPGTTGVYENGAVMRKVAPGVVTIPQHFRKHGYVAHGGGKIFHDVTPHYDPHSFNKYYWWHPRGALGSARHGSPYSVEPDPEPVKRPARRITSLTKRNFDWAAIDRPETDWPDGKVADWAAGFLAKKHEQPFFLAVGLFRPHVPWYNPRKFVKRFPLEKIKLPLVKENGSGSRLLRLQPRAITAADFDHSPYFEIIKAPFQLAEVPKGMDAVPWKGNQGALAPERQRHLSLVEPSSGNQG